jgi:hypothetical protein
VRSSTLLFADQAALLAVKDSTIVLIVKTADKKRQHTTVWQCDIRFIVLKKRFKWNCVTSHFGPHPGACDELWFLEMKLRNDVRSHTFPISQSPDITPLLPCCKASQTAINRRVMCSQVILRFEI